MFWNVLGIHVMGRFRVPRCGTCRGLMLWDVFGAHGGGPVQGRCCRTYSRPMVWDVFRTNVVARVQGPCCGTCSGPILWNVVVPYVMKRVESLSGETCSGLLLCGERNSWRKHYSKNELHYRHRFLIDWIKVYCRFCLSHWLTHNLDSVWNRHSHKNGLNIT